MTLNNLNIEAFSRFFAECFEDSLDTEASQIAINPKRRENLIQKFYSEHKSCPDLWIAAYSNNEFMGFIMAGQHSGKGFIKEVGVKPKFRRKGIAKYLITEVMRKLKARARASYFHERDFY